MGKSKRVETDTSTPVQKVSGRQNEKSSEMDHILATIYYLDWAKNVLELYAKSINKLFVVPLTEHCVRKKVANATVTEDVEYSGRAIETGRRLEEGVKVDNTNDEIKQLQMRLQLSKEDVDNISEEYVPVLEERWISLAENSAMYRLTTLNQMSGSLLIFMERIRAWIEKHRKVFSRYRRECNNVLEYAVRCFESICVQADIFSLEPVDRSRVRADCSKFIAKADPYAGRQDRKREQPFEFSSNRDELINEVKRLEAQINYYRTSVHLIGSSLTDITQSIVKALPRDVLEVTTKEVGTIMERLPPGYYFPDKYPLSVAGVKLLSKPPPNKRQMNEPIELKQTSLRTASNINPSVSSIAPRSIQSSKIAHSTSHKKSQHKTNSKRTTGTSGTQNQQQASDKSSNNRSLESEKTQSDTSHRSPPMTED